MKSNTEFNHYKLKLESLFLSLSGGKVKGKTTFNAPVTFSSGNPETDLVIKDKTSLDSVGFNPESLSADTATPVDSDVIVTKKNADGKWYQKTFSKVWDYIKGKLGIGSGSTYLKKDGTWGTPTNTTYTLSSDGANVKLTPSSGSATTASLNTLINGLTTGASTPQDDDYFISQYVGGGTTTTTYHRRPFSALWTYIKSKTDATYLKLAGGTMTGRITSAKPNKFLVTGSGTAGSTSSDSTPVYTPATWKFNTGIAAADGDMITVKMPNGGHANGVWMSIDNGTTYIPVAISGTSRLTTHYSNGQYLTLQYEANSAVTIYPKAGGTSTSSVTGLWRVVNFRDTNTTTGTTYNAGSAPNNTTFATNGSVRNVYNAVLPLAGGTMTGVLTAKANLYEDSYSGALNMNNSDIYGLNAIYTADASNTSQEGIHFYRDATHVDTLWINEGKIFFAPNRELGSNVTEANANKIGRFTATPTTGQVVVTDGTSGGMKSSGYTIAKSVPSSAVFTDTVNKAYKLIQTHRTSTLEITTDTWTSYATATVTMEAGTYFIVTTTAATATGGSPQFRTLLGSVATDSVIMSYDKTTCFTYCGLVTISAGSIAVAMQAKKNNATKVVPGNYVTLSVYAFRV